MKKILITGSKGQLGSALFRESGRFQSFKCYFTDLHELDLTNENEVRTYFEKNHFDYIINCAAYTAVDLAETNEKQAFKVNAKIPEMLALQCKNGTRLIHISTDYVYSGSVNIPHLENEQTAPASVYARSKLEGENAIKDNPGCLIIRTSWLYSEFGTNFLKTMVRLAGEKREINVVYDQIGTPTYAGDLAGVLLSIISWTEQNTFKPGIYNYANEGVCSWYDFAHEIMKYTKSNCVIKPVRTHEYPLPANRPAYSVMDKSKIKSIFDIEIPHWRDSLYTAVKNLASQL